MDDVILLDRKNEIRQSTIKSIKNCFVLLYTIYIILAVIIYIYFITISIKYNNYKYSMLCTILLILIMLLPFIVNIILIYSIKALKHVYIFVNNRMKIYPSV